MNEKSDACMGNPDHYARIVRVLAKYMPLLTQRGSIPREEMEKIACPFWEAEFPELDCVKGQGLDLRGADFTGQVFIACGYIFAGADLRGAKLNNTVWSVVSVGNATFAAANLSHSRLELLMAGNGRIDFREADLSGVHIQSMLARAVDFSSANLSDATIDWREDVPQLNLAGAIMKGCMISGDHAANFIKALSSEQQFQLKGFSTPGIHEKEQEMSELQNVLADLEAYSQKLTQLVSALDQRAERPSVVSLLQDLANADIGMILGLGLPPDWQSQRGQTPERLTSVLQRIQRDAEQTAAFVGREGIPPALDFLLASVRMNVEGRLHSASSVLSAKQLLDRTQPDTMVSAPKGHTGSSTEEASYNLVEIKSPMIGTFYRAASPEAEPFLNIGQEVGHYSIVCIVEAMSVRNEIEAEVRGTVRKILVKDATPVEYLQPLFLVEPRKKEMGGTTQIDDPFVQLFLKRIRNIQIELAKVKQYDDSHPILRRIFSASRNRSRSQLDAVLRSAIDLFAREYPELVQAQFGNTQHMLQPDIIAQKLAAGDAAQEDAPHAEVRQQNAKPKDAYAHYIIKMGTLQVVVEKERLRSTLNSDETRLLLDLSEENVTELLQTGRTTVVTMIGGRKETVTMTGCNCQDMHSHQRGDAFQFSM